MRGKKGSVWTLFLLLTLLLPSMSGYAAGGSAAASIEIEHLPDFIMTNREQQSTATFYPSAAAYDADGKRLEGQTFIWSLKEQAEGVTLLDRATGAFSVEGGAAAEEFTLLCRTADSTAVSAQVTIPLNRQVNLVEDKVGWTVQGWGKVSGAVDGYHWTRWDSGKHSRGGALAFYDAGKQVKANYFRLKLGNIKNSSSLRIAGSDALVGADGAPAAPPGKTDTVYNTAASVLPVLSPRNGNNRNCGETYWSARSANAAVEPSLEQEQVLTEKDNHGYWGEREFQYIGILNYAADTTANLGNFTVYDFGVYYTAPNYVNIALPEEAEPGAAVQLTAEVYNGVAAEEKTGVGTWSAQGFEIDTRTGVLTVPSAQRVGAVTYTYETEGFRAQTTVYACAERGKVKFANAPDTFWDLQMKRGFVCKGNTLTVPAGTTAKQLRAGIVSPKCDVKVQCVDMEGTEITEGTLKKGDAVWLTDGAAAVRYKIDTAKSGQGSAELVKSDGSYTATAELDAAVPEAVLILAAYDENKMTEMKAMEKTRAEETLTVTLPETKKGNGVRTMVWDSFENMQPLRAQEKTEIYVNRQFTGIAKDERAHGVATFTGAVDIVDTPSADSKSARITLGTDGAYIPLDKAATGSFTAKIVYQADSDVTLFAKNENGRKETLFTLPVKNALSGVKVAFDTDHGVCTLTDETGAETSAAVSLEKIAGLGFVGEGVSLTLHKLFAYSGAAALEDSYFQDYAYQEKARNRLVTEKWKSAYKTLEQGVLMGIDFYQISLFGNKLRIDGQPPRVFDGTPYVPAEQTAICLGGEVLEATESAPVRIAVNGRTLELGSSEIYRTRDTNYVSAQRMANLFGLTLSWDGEYLLGFGREKLFDETKDQSDLKAALYYQRPTGAEIFDRMQKNGDKHPRVFADAARLDEVRDNIARYPILRQWYNSLVEKAEGYANAETLYYTKPDGIRLLSVSVELLRRMENLGIAYQMTGDAKYAQTAWRDLEAVSNFGDWNPSHYLDVATMSMGVAVGYSWFYDYLTDAQKDTIAEGFTRCALNTYIEAVDRGTWWTYVNSNWNPWCHGGLLEGIVAMSDRLNAADAMYALDRMFPYMEYLYPEFIPDGGWAEGTAYHATTLRYLSLWCATLEAATGKDFGYWDLPGMDTTAYFSEVLSGADGVYNYGDNTETLSQCEAQEWFATKYNDPALAKMRYHNLLEGGRDIYLYDLLMTQPEDMGGTSAIAPDTYYQKMNIVSMRTSWTDLSDGFFLAAKGGEHGVSHFHYDHGGFVMDVGGVRFAYELGRESYSITGNDTKTYQYKKRAEGHNTYVINPDETPGQVDKAVAPVIGFDSSESGCYAIIDLSQSYKEAQDMKRGFWLTDDRRKLLIQDEVKLSEPSEVYWFMHTQGNIEVQDDGKTVYITKDGVTVRLDILDSANGGAKFEVRDALPLETTPWLEGQGRNEAFKKLTIHWDSVQDFTLCVMATQVKDSAVSPDIPAVVPMDTWEVSSR